MLAVKEKLSDYERQRLISIAENTAKLLALGLLEPETLAPPKARRAPVKRSPAHSEAARPDRKLRPRASPSKGEISSPRSAKISPRRASPRHESNSFDAAEASDDEHDYATPPRVKRARPASKAQAQTTLLRELEPEHYKQLADGLDATEWLADMEFNFLANSGVYLSYCTRPCSASNQRSIVNALKRMAGDGGTTHPYNKAAPRFQEGTPLTVSSNTAQLLEKAEAWLANYGEDKGHGWLLTHFGGFKSEDPASHLNDN
jgi:hypothetical protein